MEKSKIYDLLDNELLHKWKTEIEKAESGSWFFTNAQEVFEELEKGLDKHEKVLLKTYALAIENKVDYVEYMLKIKVLNFGIKIGMELEKSFAAMENC
ncbi:MAG: hypothetical protein FWH03_02970 [Firmicutes bacterium]|nr:hypothetical protein [Bacillota bacterium]